MPVTTEEAREKLIVALDVDGVGEAMRLVEAIGDEVVFYKIGYQLAFSGGLDLARELKAHGKKVFLDLKLLDIDNTVEKGVSSLLELSPDMLTIHAYPRAMAAAVRAAKGNPVRLLGVTVLTSMDDADLMEAGYGSIATMLVEQRAAKARDAGMGGIVCSAREAPMVRRHVGTGMLIVTPGIRPAGSAKDDQKRVVTPADAISAGATHLVVGRPVTASADPASAARAIVGEIASV